MTVGNHEPGVVFGGCGRNGLGILGGGRDGLLAQHTDAALEGLDGHLTVQERGGADADHIELLLIQHLAPVRIAFEGVLGGHFLYGLGVYIRTGDKLNTLELAVVSDVSTRDIPKADDSGSKRVRHGWTTPPVAGGYCGCEPT